MKEFIESFIKQLERPDLPQETKELFEKLLRDQAKSEQDILDKINGFLKK